MTKILFILILSLPVGLVAQTTAYDKFKDRSTVTLEIKVKDGAKPRNKLDNLNLVLAYSYSGKELTRSPDFYTARFTQSNQQWRFLKHHSLIILADKAKIELGPGKHDGKILSYGVSETILFLLLPKHLESIASATDLELQLGPFEGMVDADNLKKIKLFLSQSTKP